VRGGEREKEGGREGGSESLELRRVRGAHMHVCGETLDCLDTQTDRQIDSHAK